MKRTLISSVCAALVLGGCSTIGGIGSAKRIPANPPEFAASSPPKVDEVQSLSVERDSLARTVNQLRGEVDQLRTLFRLQNAPLEGEARSADAFAGTRAAPASSTSIVKSVEAVPIAAAVPVPVPVAKPETPKANPAATYTALFRFASSSLDDTARAALAALAPQLKVAGKVNLSAFADTSGDATVNVKLAQARAAAVEQELVKLGVSKDRIAVSTSVADSKPPEHTTILGLFRAPESMSRRVDLALLQTVPAR